ncbi:L-threonylcarbamoyladenylate synthase [Thiopseudomonas denitrificans]|uniref:Threonylcarbamoyl-AMP synthase n=1 Tax=Thiopseudomonas denitrificans TaxID=1501432 RepID=A0A4R6TZB6_9GAMM|nr:L-threonylcarbamoyladenylate synthase [Thiopseudomonas denitrificans]TDQ38222.1 translation factor SUA5 [Thiopseudomonas denitrificans]
MTSHWHLQQAAQKIRKGGVIAYPTEAVWGLGCDPWNEQAVQRILDIKQRPVHKGLILVAADIGQLTWLLEGLAAEQRQLLEDSWPGPNTWLVPHHGRVPKWISGRHTSVAVRVSDHPLVQELCRLTGPLVSTSANPTKHPAATSRLHVEQYFHNQLDAVLNAPLGHRQQPSTIRDLLSGEVLR